MFLERVRQLEERLFPNEFGTDDRMRLKSDRYFWHYRPSHHVETGLITEEDLQLLKTPGKRLLSLGAYPAYLERILVELGVPSENILVTDTEEKIVDCGLPAIAFDVNEPWPEIGMFDRIIFPESLCIAIGGRITKDPSDTSYATDTQEASLLAAILRQALQRLQPDGIIRANGPMSHPNVVRAASETLNKAGIKHTIDYQRFFMTITHN